ncbi:unnamed protein product, partial [Ascophyllum nodosum]
AALQRCEAAHRAVKISGVLQGVQSHVLVRNTSAF